MWLFFINSICRVLLNNGWGLGVGNNCCGVFGFFISLIGNWILKCVLMLYLELMCSWLLSIFIKLCIIVKFKLFLLYFWVVVDLVCMKGLKIIVKFCLWILIFVLMIWIISWVNGLFLINCNLICIEFWWVNLIVLLSKLNKIWLIWIWLLCIIVVVVILEFIISFKFFLLYKGW